MVLKSKIQSKLIPALFIACCPLVMAGCHSDDPVSPNEKTAAPAHLPGVDPKAPPSFIQHQKGSPK